MSNRHWIDDLSAAFAGQLPRRAILGLASALTAAVVGHAVGQPAMARNGGKGGRKKPKKKPKKKLNQPKPPKPPVSHDECDVKWPEADQQPDREFCKFIRRQCDGNDPRQFCIVEEFDGHEGEKVAVCCEVDRKCCGEACCLLDAECCGGRCCGTSANPHLACCSGRCIDTRISADHCGGCGDACRGDERCDSVCGCMDPAFKCCAPGYHCRHEFDCVAVGVNPDGSTAYGCF